MSPKVLIVEDQLPLAQAVARLLSRYDIAADISGDGIEALKQYSCEPYDLLIIDLQLPRLSGVEVIRKIRSTNRGKTLPIIIVTGVYKGDEYAKKAREAFGIKYYLEKPFPQETFLMAVKELLGPTSGVGKPAPTKAQPARAQPKFSPEPKVAVTVTDLRKLPAPAEASAGEGAASKPGPKQLAEIKPRKAIQGDLRTQPIDKLLVEAQRQRITGILFVKKDDDDREFLLINGVPIGMRTKKLESSFGNYLFCQGKISLMEYQVYQGNRNGTDSDEIIIKMGCLLPGEYFTEWKLYLENSLIQMFSWPEAQFTFQFWPPLPEGSSVPPLNLAHIIHQGYSKHVNEERVEASCKNASGRFLVLTPKFFDHQMHLAIDPAEALFLHRIDGSHMFDELLPSDSDESVKVKRTLGAFLALGMVELRDSPGEVGVEAPFPIREREIEGEALEEEDAHEAPGTEAAPEALGGEETFDDLLDDLEDTLGDVVEEMEQAPQEAPDPEHDEMAEQKKLEDELSELQKAIKTKNYYEVFGMKHQTFDFTKFKNEYFRMSKAFSPEHFITSSGDILEKSEEVLSMLSTAFNTLSNVVSKEKYDEMLSSQASSAGVPGGKKDHDKMQAEVAYQSGMAFMEMGDWNGAEKSLVEAVSLAPKNADILSQYAYSIFNKNRKSKAGQRRALELLAQALKLKPRCAPAFAYRGALLLDDEKTALAEADFKKALSINPRYRFALKGLKKIERQKQEEKKGLFSRFRK